MNNLWMKIVLMLVGVVGYSSAQAAVDSYRFMHVTIATPWYIFLFLLMGIFAPFILMAVLAWSSAARKTDRELTESVQKPTAE